VDRCRLQGTKRPAARGQELAKPGRTHRYSGRPFSAYGCDSEEATAVGEVCRKAGISEGPFYNWRKKYAGPMPSEMKRVGQFEEENGKPKKIMADLSLDKAML